MGPGIINMRVGEILSESNFDTFKVGKPITFIAYHSSDSEIKRILLQSW